MFCSVKKSNTKNDIAYRFYLCERYRDKSNGKVKSSDKFIISLPHDFIIDPHMLKAISNKIIRECKTKGFDKDIYADMVFDKFLDIREELIEIKNQKQKEEYQKSWEQQSYYNQYFCSVNTTSNYTDKEKEYLKKIYRSAAKALHPDITGDNDGMQFLNKLKEQWGI